MTMQDQVMRLLKHRWITPLDALRLAGCLSLAQRVSQWRAAGIKITDKWVTTPTGKRIKAYRVSA